MVIYKITNWFYSCSHFPFVPIVYSNLFNGFWCCVLCSVIKSEWLLVSHAPWSPTKLTVSFLQLNNISGIVFGLWVIWITGWELSSQPRMMRSRCTDKLALKPSFFWGWRDGIVDSVPALHCKAIWCHRGCGFESGMGSCVFSQQQYQYTFSLAYHSAMFP